MTIFRLSRRIHENTDDSKVLLDILFGVGFLIAAVIGFMYFRDLGDVAQMLIKVRRANMVRFIRHEYHFLSVGLGAALVAIVVHLGLEGGSPLFFWLLILLLALFYAFPWVYVHLGLTEMWVSGIAMDTVAMAMQLCHGVTCVVCRMSTRSWRT